MAQAQEEHENALHDQNETGQAEPHQRDEDLHVDFFDADAAVFVCRLESVSPSADQIGSLRLATSCSDSSLSSKPKWSWISDLSPESSESFLGKMRGYFFL